MSEPQMSQRLFRGSKNFSQALSRPGGPAVIGSRSLTNAIKIGLVGCGKRGTGAAAQALKADEQAELVAIADIDGAQMQSCLSTLKKVRKVSSQVKVEDRRYRGLNGFRDLIAGDVDLVILATPPGFRPLHLAACVEAGKHVFCEKPVATDAYGVHWVLRSVAQARRKNLSLMGGLCMRYNPVTTGMFQALAEGAIGNLTAYHATYFSNEIKAMPPASARPPGMTDAEWQIRNWYNFVWLSGDGLVEQAIHSVDRISWAMNDQPPLHCSGSGGRATPSGEGNIYDHFSIVYTYPNRVQAILNSRQIDGCYNNISDLIIGTEGTCSYGWGSYPAFHTSNKGHTLGPAKTAANFALEQTGSLGSWLKERGDLDMYQTQQNVLMQALRDGRRIEDGEQLATSTLLAIMGRTAAYTGQQITWEKMLESDERLVPEHIDWNADLPVPPRARPGLQTRRQNSPGIAAHAE